MPTLFSLEGLAAGAAFAKVAYDTFEWYKGRRRAGVVRRRLRSELGSQPMPEPPHLVDPRTRATAQYRAELARAAQRRNPRSLESLAQVMASTPVRRDLVNLRSNGDKGADERVGYIMSMIQKYRVDPHVRKIASDVLSRKDGNGRWAVPEKDWIAEVRAIFTFVRHHVRYQRDPYGTDTYTSPLRTLAWFKAGDCDCYTILGGALLQSVGYPLRIRIIQQRGRPTWGHIYLMVGVPPMGPDQWIPFDASMNKALGFQPPRAAIARFKDFPVE